MFFGANEPQRHRKTQREEHRGKYKRMVGNDEWRMEGNNEWRMMNFHSPFSILCGPPSVSFASLWFVYNFSDYFGANEPQRHREHRGKSTEVNIRGWWGMMNGE
jgi:hypothetical protein